MTTKVQHTPGPLKLAHERVSIGPGFDGYKEYVIGPDGQDVSGTIDHATKFTKYAGDMDRTPFMGERTFEDGESFPHSDTARLLAAAYTSYDKHFGPNAVEAAEADLLGEALAALEAQELFSDMQRADTMPQPDDPRYTPFIGQWDGYQAPEVRLNELAVKRRELRRALLDKTKGE